MSSKYIPGRYIQSEIDCIIEIVRDTHNFEPVRVRDVQNHIKNILNQHELEILANLEKNQNPKVSKSLNDSV
ncbi:hypothetical protein [Streptococcus parauberis]|uniref:hypothetical protein n=1 Tax=Streptococcus parauberis TaxID=1348 RepID=UPI0002ECD07C|nr:hypothetical protein [Streptococcus parauberis]PIA83700.1 hypothetical protein ADO07_01568 [Streptococcus parauberis]QBX17949.1 hypothetical protein Javan385_0046 [Streptococcus phage Javan385]UWM91891.1 hypothetical protein N2A94_04460 [Streptococcus parauberis]